MSVSKTQTHLPRQLPTLWRYRIILRNICIAALLVCGLVAFKFAHRPVYSDQKHRLQILNGGLYISEETLRHNVLRYTQIRNDLEPDLLWLGMTYDSESWSTTLDGEDRNVTHLHQIIAEEYNPENVSLGLLTSSMAEYEAYKKSLKHQTYAKVSIFFHPGFHQGPVVAREHRHDDEFQTARRSELAKLRNYLMLKTLDDEAHIVWLDADVVRVGSGIVRRMIQHSDNQKKYGILTALCNLGEEGNYDLNAWSGTRQGPRGWDLTDEELQAGEEKQQGQHHVEELIKGTGNNDIKPLATVGATILYIRGSLVSQGLSFSTQYVVGTRWGKNGWDGIESEGICYMAKSMEGGGCGVLGGTWRVSHN